ncbi:hypothetical protein E2C01_030980 [Portunus trituberculatus]|uniref:Uncharacterized protein n=1 Tax=Portunus trituberculatus TaxID=210409 RepID=A0A5B7EWV7_PORTR|nr:hypothetical protein [Portunus trituberculatus]
MTNALDAYSRYGTALSGPRVSDCRAAGLRGYGGGGSPLPRITSLSLVDMNIYQTQPCKQPIDAHEQCHLSTIAEGRLGLAAAPVSCRDPPGPPTQHRLPYYHLYDLNTLYLNFTLYKPIITMREISRII